MIKIKFLGVKESEFSFDGEWHKDLIVGNVYETVNWCETDKYATVIDGIGDELFLTIFRLKYFEVVE